MFCKPSPPLRARSRRIPPLHRIALSFDRSRATQRRTARGVPGGGTYVPIALRDRQFQSTGFEPVTRELLVRCSTQLSYLCGTDGTRTRDLSIDNRMLYL